jgi:hypothetical protein
MIKISGVVASEKVFLKKYLFISQASPTPAAAAENVLNPGIEKVKAASLHPTITTANKKGSSKEPRLLLPGPALFIYDHLPVG